MRAVIAIVASATLAATLGATMADAGAALPRDPQAARQQPLRIMRVGTALARAGRLRDVPVLVADTGLDLRQPDLAPRLFSVGRDVRAPNPDGLPDPGTVRAGAHGWDLIGTPAPFALAPDADPSDPPAGSGHGTLVAGLLGAAWNNHAGGAGVAPNARFVALRTCWDGDQCYQYVQAAAFAWAAARGVRVVSMSWLVGAPEPDFVAAIRGARRTLFVTIPSGPEPGHSIDGEQRAPCTLDLPNVLCVTTSSPRDKPSCGAFGRRAVDVAVPVESSVTTGNGGGFVPTRCATSYAAPTAAGIATILFGAEPGATPQNVKAAIVAGARRVPGFRGRTVSEGIVDAVGALRALRQRLGDLKS